MAVATSEWITREQLLDRYEIQESTLDSAEASDLLSVVEVDKNGRGYLTYRITELTDLLFRVLRVFPFEISNAKVRLLPMQRVLLFYCIRGGLDQAVDIMHRGSVLNYDKKDIAARWNLFLKRVPKEALPFIKGKTDERNEAVNCVLEILEIKDAFEDPEIVMKSAITGNFQVRGMTEGLIQMGMNPTKIASMLGELHRIDISGDHIKDYRHYYYDPYFLTPKDIRNYCNKTGSIPGYTDVLEKALTCDEMLTFIGQMGWATAIKYEEECHVMMRNERKVLAQPHVGKDSQKRYHQALNNLIKLAESLHGYQSDTGEEANENEDLLKLRHDTEVNKKQLTMEDLEGEDVDEFGANTEDQSA